MLLSDLALQLGLELCGPDLEICGVNTLDAAGPEELSFFANPKYRVQLEKTRAAVLYGYQVVLIRKSASPEDLAGMAVTEGVLTKHGRTL